MGKRVKTDEIYLLTNYHVNSLSPVGVIAPFLCFSAVFNIITIKNLSPETTLPI